MKKVSLPKIKRTRDGKFNYNIKARNNEVLVSCETLESEANAINNLDALLDVCEELLALRKLGKPYYKTTKSK